MSISPVEVRYWHIYKIENPDGQCYIGRTDNPERRYHIHFSDVKAYKSVALEKSFAKHSKKSHTFEILDSFYGTINRAHAKEIFWTRTYMSNINRWPERKGLNVTDGGKSISGFKFLPESSEKRAAKNRGRKHTPEQVAANIARQIGKKRSKKDIEKAAKGRWKPVLVYDLNGNFIREYESIKATYNGLGIPRGGHIGEVCRGERWMYHKYIFKFKNQ